VTAQPLTRIEQAIVQILDIDSRREVLGREMRSLLRRLGFRRSAPALVFTMKSLEDKGLVDCREEIRIVDGVTVTDRYYRAAAN
jgi:DNA-binding transcriptional ArsR family regulator